MIEVRIVIASRWVSRGNTSANPIFSTLGEPACRTHDPLFARDWQWHLSSAFALSEHASGICQLHPGWRFPTVGAVGRGVRGFVDAFRAVCEKQLQGSTPLETVDVTLTDLTVGRTYATCQIVIARGCKRCLVASFCLTSRRKLRTNR